MNTCRRVLAALATALLCHGLFTAAVASMAYALLAGLQIGIGARLGLGDAAGRVANLLLVLQFPLVHSGLLSGRGRRWLVRLSPFGHGSTLAISTYVVIGSLQLLAAFWLWTPSGTVWHEPTGIAGVYQYALFAAAWLFLIKALADAGLAVQSGAAGWWALLRNRAVDYGPMPTTGLFARCRQPIYFGFAAVLWTAPTWSPDWLFLCIGWSAYCVLGPRLKEARWEGLFGEHFRAYRTGVPYFVPRIRR
ncbi:MAG: isoprenylcysteine carboxylmethyltransferase family protein [Planctomycetes bacterium]|nr:isoprenylcysteine carboxylmethyltransferase family protein [Planctomycetota bacterium]